MKKYTIRIAYALVLTLLVTMFAALPAAAAENPSSGVGNNIYGYDWSQVSRMYAQGYHDYIYAPLNNDTAAQVVPRLMKAGNNSPRETGETADGTFLVVLRDGSKFTCILAGDGVRVSGVEYPLNATDYQTLVNVANQTLSAGPAYIQWLVYMSPDRVKEITWHPDGESAPRTVPQDRVEQAAKQLRLLQAVQGTTGTYQAGLMDFTKMPGRNVMKIKFESGIEYSIAIQRNRLYIESSDMSYGLMYHLETSMPDIINTFNKLSVR